MKKKRKEKMKHHIIYHMDADGHAGGAVIMLFLRREGIDWNDIVFHPINYGMPTPEGIDYKKDRVYMVDFSLQPAKEMVSFAEKLGKRLIWIDHHSTSLEMEKEYRVLKEAMGARFVKANDVPISGCELASKYFFGKMVSGVLEIIGDWDTWRHKDQSEARSKAAKNFQYYLKARETDPINDKAKDWWKNVLSVEGWNREGFIYLEKGASLRSYQQKEWKELMQGKSFDANFMGLRAIMINQAGNSTMFDGFYDPGKHDVMITFQMVKGEYLTVSMYTDKIEELHLGDLAQKVGMAGDKPSGGGHAGAAGFQCGWEYFKTLYALS